MKSQSHSIRAAFDQGQLPKIACFNKASIPLGVEFEKLCDAMQTYVDKHFAPVWGAPARLIQTTGFIKGSWAMVFLDTADAPGALAYHDLTPDGLPLSKVFVRTTLENGDLVSISASHELAEMLVDPAINLFSTGPRKNALYAYETADPVEALSFNVAGIPMSDFVFPSYFELFRKPGSVKFDYLGKIKRPFEILKGGYQIIWENGQEKQIFGSKAKEKSFRLEDRRGHRCAYRNNPPKERSRPLWGKPI